VMHGAPVLQGSMLLVWECTMHSWSMLSMGTVLYRTVPWPGAEDVAPQGCGY